MGNSVSSRTAKTSKNRLLEAAASIVARDGARHLTIDAVAGESGLSKGGVLYHFPSKRALLEGMLEKLLAEIDARVATLRDQSDISHLGAWIDSELAQSGRQRATSLALLANAAEDPSLLAPAQSTVRQQFAEVKRESRDPDLSLILLLATEGIRFMDMLRLLPLSATDRQRLQRRLQALAAEVTS